MFRHIYSHQLMLADKIRMTAYERAINETIKKGDIVCDIGTGSGILSFLAVQAGAKRVYAIEKNEAIIKEARKLANTNRLEKKIIFINDSSDEVKLPEKADVIVCELLGNFGLEENIVKFQTDARKRFLKSGGKLLPSWLDLYLAPIESSALWQNYIGVWNKNFYGVNFSAVKEYAVSNRYTVDYPDKIYFLAKPSLIYHLNFYKDEDAPFLFKGKFIINRKGVFHGLVGYFKAGLAKNVILSTSPQGPVTHWKQTFFPMRESVGLEKGDIVYYTLKAIPYGNEIFWEWRIKILRNRSELADFNQTNLNINKEDLVIRHGGFKPVLTQEAKVYRRVLSLCNGKKTIEKIAKIINSEYPFQCRTEEEACSKVIGILYRKVKLREDK